MNANEAVIAGYVRTPIGRYGGALAGVRPDDAGWRTPSARCSSAPTIDPAEVDDVILGCANQAGEDNRNVARMAALLAGLPVDVPGQTVNRLCGSGLQAVNAAAQAIWSGQGDVFIAGGVESMTRAPLVMLKPESALPARRAGDGRLDARLALPAPDLEEDGLHAIRSARPPRTWPSGAASRARTRTRFAVRSQPKTARALREAADWRRKIVAVSIAASKGRAGHRRARRAPAAGHHAGGAGAAAAGVRQGRHGDGRQLVGHQRRRGGAAGHLGRAGALIRAAAAGARRRDGRRRRAPRRDGPWADPGLAQGARSAPAWRSTPMNIVELNEAFASQVIACLDDLGVDWHDDERVNPNGGAIALGHPLGASGARLAGTARSQLHQRQAQYALVTMCIGVGQGIATILEGL